MSQLQTWKCVVCDQIFKVGDWTCADGISNHVVAAKTYRSLDAPSDPGHPAAGGMDSKRDGRTVICNIPPEQKVTQRGDDGQDKVIIKAGGSVEFIRGCFSTSDPEIQYYLDKKPGYNATQEQWERAWLSDSQQLELERMKLQAMRQRLENERNELLASVKAQKTKTA